MRQSCSGQMDRSLFRPITRAARLLLNSFDRRQATRPPRTFEVDRRKRRPSTASSEAGGRRAFAMQSCSAAHRLGWVENHSARVPRIVQLGRWSRWSSRGWLRASRHRVGLEVLNSFWHNCSVGASLVPTSARSATRSWRKPSTASSTSSNVIAVASHYAHIFALNVSLWESDGNNFLLGLSNRSTQGRATVLKVIGRRAYMY